MSRVLVTYGWCRTAYIALQALAAAGHEVFVCSSRRPAMTAWSRFSRGSAMVADPFEQPAAYARDIAGLVRRWGIEVVLPGHEDGIPLRQFQAELPADVVLACPALAELQRAVDKAEMTRLAMAIGVSTPRTAFPDSVEAAVTAAEAIGFPVVVKLRRSNGGKGVRLAQGPGEVRAALEGPFQEFCSRPERFPFIQQYCPGTIVGGCLMAREGTVLASFGERYLRSKDNAFGTSVYREPCHSAAIEEAVGRLSAALQWTGISHFDFIETPDAGELLFLEMNPRPWGALHLAYVNGYDFPGAAVAQALGLTDVARFFPGRGQGDRRSLWLVGEAIRGVTLVRSRQWRALLKAPLEVLHGLWCARVDDFLWHDPLPLLAEAICYGKGFFGAGGDTNPGSRGMFGD